MPTRKYHHKSTTGCAECKTARVKCDENKPECTRCARQGRSCSYLRQNNDGSPASSSGQNQTSSDDVVSIATYEQDLELMHHWSVHAYVSLSKDPSVRWMWQNVVIKQALKFPFLMRAILALSAIHLAYSTPQPSAVSPGPSSPSETMSIDAPSPRSARQTTRAKWHDRAFQDYGAALVMAQPELENITEHNCNACLLFSSTIAILRMGMPQITGDYGPDGVLGYILESFQLLRGKGTITDVSRDWILRGPLKSIIADRQVSAPREIPATIAHVMDSFETQIKAQVGEPAATPEDRERLNAYLFTIAGFRAYFACELGSPASVRIASAWPARVPPVLMTDLRNNEPLSLALLGYYAVMLDDQREMWWIADTGKQLLLHVAQVLGGEWAAALGPAREHMEMDMDYWAEVLSMQLHAGEGTGDFKRGEGYGRSHSEQAPTPDYSQFSTDHDSALGGEGEDSGGEPAVQTSPFGVSTIAGELPGQTKRPMH